ncbi:hypothetical protein Tco_0988741 [Tanacetum coccineum]|uniref:Reverse transcriptase domain-containing protein n=1 Tax=Tanacetum coccineum TaxID=301880 RepID=A0ABQ5ES05_9ASTR
MAYTSSRSSSSSDNEVYDDSYSSKSCRKNTENLTTKISKLREELFDSESDLCNYKRGLSQVEARLVEFKINESKFCEKIRVLERDLELKDYKIKNLTNELEEVKKERDGIDSKLEKFVNSSKDLDQMLESQKSGGSVGNVLSKPMISFVKETGCPSVSKVNNTEKSRKPTVKYAEMYRMRPVNAAKPKAAYNTVKRNRFNAVKASACWVWMPKNRVVDRWMHRLRGGMSMIKKLMQKLLLLVQKLMILLLKLKCTSEGVQQRRKIKKKGRGFLEQKCMRTRSQSRNSNRQQQQVNPTFVEPFNLVEPIENQAPPVVTMDDTRTMVQLLEAPTVASWGFRSRVVTFWIKCRDCLRIIESKSKVRNSRNKPVVAKVSASSSTLGISPDVAELKDMVKALLLDKKTQAPVPFRLLPSNTITNPKVDLKSITTRSGVAYQGPTIPTTTSSPPKVVEREPEVTKDTVLPTNNGSTKDVQPPVVQTLMADPAFPIFSGRILSKTRHALIDVYEGELTLRVGKEAVTFNLDQTSRYSSNYDDMTANRIDVIEMACEEYSQEVLGFSDVIASGNPTPYYDPIVSTSSPTLTPFGDSDFLLEEVDAFLALEDDPTSPEVDDSYYDPEGDILLLESFLNDDPSPPPNQGNYLPEIRKELKICETKNDKSSIDEPPEVELKDLPPHLEYAFLEGDNKLPVIIAKDLSVEEKAALIKVLKSHKRAIA